MTRLLQIVVSTLLFWGQQAFAEAPASYTLTVTAQQVDILGRALGKEPYVEVNALINQLNQQIAAQNAAAAKKPEEKPSGEVPGKTDDSR